MDVEVNEQAKGLTMMLTRLIFWINNFVCFFFKSCSHMSFNLKMLWRVVSDAISIISHFAIIFFRFWMHLNFSLIENFQLHVKIFKLLEVFVTFWVVWFIYILTFARFILVSCLSHANRSSNWLIKVSKNASKKE